MGQTKKRSYERYTLAFKTQAVKLANHLGVKAPSAPQLVATFL